MKALGKTNDQAQYSVHPWTGLQHLLNWLRNPVSLEGASRVPKIKMAMGGPEFQQRVEDMRQHPDGRHILEQKPDLGRALDAPELADYPPDSLGGAYYAHGNFEGAVPGYLLASLIYYGKEFEQLDWSEDMKYLLYRMGNTHDLLHQLSGYGTDLAGESLVISYTLGFESPEPDKAARHHYLWSRISWLMMMPSVGYRAYLRHSQEAFERGVATAARCAPHNIPWEAMLDQPVTRVREQLGVPPLREPVFTADWQLSRLGRAIARGYNSNDEKSTERMLKMDAVVKSGVPVRIVINLDDRSLDQHFRALGTT